MTAAALSRDRTKWPVDNTAYVVFVFVVACIAVAATLIATRQGPGLNQDSTFYLSAGINLAHGHGLRTFDGPLLTQVAPGLPVVVAVGQWLGISAGWTIRLFNAAAFAGSVYLGFVLLKRHLRSHGLVVASTVLLAVSAPLLAVSRFAWTEPAFVVACLGFVLALEHVVSLPRRPAPWLATAALLVWVGFMFRYAGVALIPAGGLALFLGCWRAGWRTAVRCATGFLVLSAVVPALWMLRNQGVDGTYLGPRGKSVLGFVATVKHFVFTLGYWVAPTRAQSSMLQHLAGIGVVLIAGFVLVWLAIERRTDPADRADCATGDAGPSLVPLLAFIGTYSIYMVGAQLTTDISPLGNRLLIPLYVPLVVLGAWALETVCAKVSPPARRSPLVMAVLVIALFLVSQFVLFADDVRTSAREGDGYANQHWRSSELAKAVRAVPKSAQIYSNDPYPLWALLRREPLLFAPRVSAAFPRVPPSFIHSVECHHDSYLAWFNGSSTPGRVSLTPQQLRSRVGLEVASVGTDGTLYRIKPLPGVATKCVSSEGTGGAPHLGIASRP